MIIVAGTITIGPDDLEAVRAAGADMMVATRQEEGCVEYAFSVDLADPSIVHVFEIWESQAALEAHFVAPHMAVFLEALSKVRVTNRDLSVYDAAKTGTL